MSKNSVISVTLDLNASGFTSQITKANGLVLNLNTNIKNLQVNTQAAQGHAENLGGAFSAAAINTLVWVTALEQLKATFIELPKSIIETNAEIQKTQVMLAGLSTASTEAARTAEGKQQLQWIYDLGKSAPFSVAALQDAFVKLKSVGIDPTTGSLQALVDAVSKAGAGDEKLRDASLAIQEMAGRGTVSLEQLRRQLGKAIPDAIQAMAYSMGLTYGELMEKVQKGTLKSTTALQALFDQLERQDAGQGLQHMQNLTGVFAQISTSWIEMQQTIGNSGFIQEIEKQLEDLISIMNSPAGSQFAKEYGQQLAELVGDVREAIDFFIRYRNEIEATATALVEIAVASKVTTVVKEMTAAFVANGVAIEGAWARAWNTGAVAMEAWTGKAVFTTTAERALAMAAGPVMVGIRGVQAALETFLGPIGIAAVMLYQLADALGAFDDAAEKARADAASGIVSKETVATLQEANTELDAQIAQVKKLRDFNLSQGPARAGTQLADQIARENEQMAALLAQKKKNSDAIIQAETTMTNNEADAYVSAQSKAIQKELDDLGVAYEKRYQAIREDMTKNKEGSDARKQNDADRIANDKQYYAAAEDLLNKHIAAMEQKAKTGTAAEVTAANSELTRLYAQLRGFQSRDNANTDLLGPQTEQKTKEGLTRVQQEILHFTEGSAEAMAKMQGQGENLAKVMVQLAHDPEFMKATDDEKKALIAGATAMDQHVAASKRLESQQQRSQTAWNAITTKTTESTAKLKELDAELLRGGQFKDPMGLITLDAELQRYRDELIATKHPIEEVNVAIQAAHDATLKARLDQQFMKWADSARQLNDQLQDTSKETIEANFAREKEAADEILALDDSKDEKRKKIEENYYAYIGALREKANRDEENGFQRLARTWQDSSKAMGDAMEKWADDGTTAIAQFVTTGKLDMKSLTDEIIQDIIKIELQKALASSLGSAGDWVAKILGIGSAAAGLPFGSAPALTESVGSVPDLTIPTQTFHTGGLLGLDSGSTARFLGMSTWANAPKFHTGGVLGADEMPIIARKGEGVFTPAQMAAMGGGMPSITVNVINQSGQQVDAEQHKPRFDGEALILDVVLRGASRPGNFRNGLKGAISS